MSGDQVADTHSGPRIVQGRLREARVYLWHCIAVLRPGVEVPLFGKPARLSADIASLDSSDHKLLIEEGRRQLDRQIADLERMRARGATLVTVALAEVALLSGGAHRFWSNESWPVTAAWLVSTACVGLGLAGAIAVLTARAVLGRTDTAQAATCSSPILPELAFAYAEATGIGEETVRTRLTVVRDAVLLLVVGAITYAAAWPFTR